MTGRDLIIFILENKFEDEVFFEDGNIPGFMTLNEYAAYRDVGVETVKLWYYYGYVDAVRIGDALYFPKNHLIERGNDDE